MTDVEGVLAEKRLREISDELAELRAFADAEPGNILMINLLEMERKTLMTHYIRAVS